MMPFEPESERVSGSIIDMPITEDKPGMTPTQTPQRAPENNDKRLAGLITDAKAWKKALIVLLDIIG
jgi:hypothetical protein